MSSDAPSRDVRYRQTRREDLLLLALVGGIIVTLFGGMVAALDAAHRRM